MRRFLLRSDGLKRISYSTMAIVLLAAALGWGFAQSQLAQIAPAHAATSRPSLDAQQLSLVADGRVSNLEIESALQATADCIFDASNGTRVVGWYSETAAHASVVVSGPADDGTVGSPAVDECIETNLNSALDARAHTLGAALPKGADQAFVDCVVANGFDVGVSTMKDAKRQLIADTSLRGQMTLEACERRALSARSFEFNR